MDKMTENRRKVIEEFRFYMMWGEWPGERKYDKEKFALSVKKPKDVRLAVNKAYTDMSPRTIDGFGDEKLKEKNNYTNEEINTKKYNELDNIKKNLVDEIVDIFNGKAFDKEEHRKTCDNFIEDFNVMLGSLDSEIETIEFGKAQKIVNMTFKYLLLFDDAFDYMEVFEKCDMALDSYILKQYKKKIKNDGKVTKAWSKLEVDEYNEIQKKIKDYIENKTENKTGQAPIFAEFEWWKEAKNKK